MSIIFERMRSIVFTVKRVYCLENKQPGITLIIIINARVGRKIDVYY